MFQFCVVPPDSKADSLLIFLCHKSIFGFYDLYNPGDLKSNPWQALRKISVKSVLKETYHAFSLFYWVFCGCKRAWKFKSPKSAQIEAPLSTIFMAEVNLTGSWKYKRPIWRHCECGADSGVCMLTNQSRLGIMFQTEGEYRPAALDSMRKPMCFLST